MPCGILFASNAIASIANVESVMLFGAVAESAFRFHNAEIALVAPAEFSTLPPNAKLMR